MDTTTLIFTAVAVALTNGTIMYLFLRKLYLDNKAMLRQLSIYRSTLEDVHVNLAELADMCRAAEANLKLNLDNLEKARACMQKDLPGLGS